MKISTRLAASIAVIGLSLTACGTAASAGQNLKVYVGYADNLQTVGARATNPPAFPSPWNGDRNVVFKGAAGKVDSGVIRIENASGQAQTVQSVTADVGGKHYDLWGSNLTVPANGSLVLAGTQAIAPGQTEGNFDTSEPNTTNAGGPPPPAGASGSTPVIHLTLNGSTTTYQDTQRVLTTGGKDIGSQPGKPNESHQWALLAAPLASASSGSPSWVIAPLVAALASILTWIPALLGALLLLLIGWLLAGLVSRLVTRLLLGLGLARMAARTNLLGFLAPRREGDTAAPGVQVVGWIGRLAGWFVFLIFAIMAAHALQVPAVTVLLTAIALWIPRLIVALIIVLIGAFVAQLVAGFVRRRAGGPSANLLAVLAQAGILSLAILVALNQVGIATVLVTELFAGMVFAVALALGLAFGLGGEKTARQLTHGWQRPFSSADMKEVASSRRTPAATTKTKGG